MGGTKTDSPYLWLSVRVDFQNKLAIEIIFCKMLLLQIIV